MGYILTTYLRRLILRVTTLENQMPCCSLMTQEQRLLSWSVGNLIQAVKCLFLPLII